MLLLRPYPRQSFSFMTVSKLMNINCNAGGKGYTFAAWLRLESVDSTGGTAGGRSLYSLLSVGPNRTLRRGLAAAFKGVRHCLMNRSTSKCCVVQDVISLTSHLLGRMKPQSEILSGMFTLKAVTAVVKSIKLPKEKQVRELFNIKCFCECNTGDALVVRIFQPRAFELPLFYNFLPRRWYHVAIVHSSGGALSTPAVSLFVNGTQVFNDKFKYPKVLLA